MIRGQIWTVSRLEYAGQCRDNLDSGINKPTRTVGWRHLGALELLPWRKDETETNIVLAGPDAECTYTWYLCTNMCQRTCVREPATQWDDGAHAHAHAHTHGKCSSDGKRECSQREPVYLCPWHILHTERINTEENCPRPSLGRFKFRFGFRSWTANRIAASREGLSVPYLKG